MKTKTTKRSMKNDCEDAQAHARSRQRRKRTFFTNEQLDRLEEVFQRERFPGITTREDLTEELGIKEDRIQVWFQNRRARWRKREIKNKPASGRDPQPLSAAWPDYSLPTHPQTITGFTSLLPFTGWTQYQRDTDDESSLAVNPVSKFTFPVPLTYNALPFDLPFDLPSVQSVCSESGSSSRSSSPVNHLSPTESSDSECNSRDCKFIESSRLFEVPSTYSGRKIHSIDEYNAAIGLLSVLERQD